MVLPSDSAVWLGDVLDVARLAAYLRSGSRTRPVAVLTVGAGRTAPHVSIDLVIKQAGGRADVVIIPTDVLTRSFAEAVPPGASVYRGACRVYPPGAKWENDPHSVPLRLAQTPEQIDQLPRLILADLQKAIAHPLPASGGGPSAGERTQKTPTASPSPNDPNHDAQPATHVPYTIETPDDARSLAAHLLSRARQQPVVVVSRRAGERQAIADANQLRQDLTGLAEVCEIATPAASWEFSRAVPPMCQVYGGAGRGYPVGDDWLTDPRLSPLRLASGFASRTDLTRQLVSDTMSLASRGSYATSVAAATQRPVTGRVLGSAAGRGIVILGTGEPGVVWPELLEPGLPAERLFVKDMIITGDFDPISHRIDVRNMRRQPTAAVMAYQAGMTILVRVEAVAPEHCTVALFPGVTVDVPAEYITDDPEPDLRDLLSVGETVPALVVERDATTGEWLVSLEDAGGMGDAAPAPSILAGGPPWLVPPEPATVTPLPAVTPVADEAAFRPDQDSGIVRELRLEIAQLTELLRQSGLQVKDLENQLRTARTQRREGQRRSRADREANARTQAENDLHLFADEADQFSFEIRLAWARSIHPSDKARWELKAWTYGTHFFPTLNAMQGVSRSKIVDVIVDVLTGRDSELASRERHALRTGPGGDDPQRVRKGGQDKAWRVSIQVGTASARRLHYWQCADGSIELASIRYHDDFET